MSAVNGFPLLLTLTGETKIPVSQRSNAELPGNFSINPNLLATWLESAGFARNVSAVPLRFYDNFVDLPAGVANTLYAVRNTGRGLYFWSGSEFVNMYDTSSGSAGTTSGGVSYTTLSGGGISVEVGYSGTGNIELTGSAGVYKVTFPTGTSPVSIDVEALAEDVNTASGNFTITTKASRRHKGNHILEDLSSGRLFITGPGLEILRSSVNAGEDTLTINGIESNTDGFGVNLKF